MRILLAIVTLLMLLREDAKRLNVMPLDLDGLPSAAQGHADEIQLQPSVVYYLITNGSEVKP